MRFGLAAVRVDRIQGNLGSSPPNLALLRPNSEPPRSQQRPRPRKKQEGGPIKSKPGQKTRKQHRARPQPRLGQPRLESWRTANRSPVAFMNGNPASSSRPAVINCHNLDAGYAGNVPYRGLLAYQAKRCSGCLESSQTYCWPLLCRGGRQVPCAPSGPLRQATPRGTPARKERGL